MNRLFLFGYESPTERQSNAEHGTDFESSTGVWIASASEQEAVDWGRAIAERFVTWLCEHEGKPPYSWINGQLRTGSRTIWPCFPPLMIFPLSRLAECRILHS